MRRLGFFAAVALLIFSISLAGCGEKEGGEEAKKDDTAFKVPDSLLSPKDRFKLTIDEYHPVKGGVIGNKDIVVEYPPTEIYDYISRRVFGIAFDSYNKIKEDIGPPSDGKVVCIGAKDLEEYTLLHKKEWWYYGVIKGDTIYFEPYNIMLKRYDRQSEQTVAEIAFQQKLAQMALRERSGGKIPLWLREAVASYVAGEGTVIKAGAAQWRKEFGDFKASERELNSYLEVADGLALTRVSFYIAYQMLENLLEISSMEDVLAFVDRLGEGKTLDEASDSTFGMGYAALIEKISDYEAVPDENWKM